ncbi:MAG TPA: MFS transporter [Ignavibacteriaceae bacterium]|nr:MFS transporter [Ignavibacteriaceae bacterium]
MLKKAEWRNPWLWVPSLYYAEGIPYVMVMTVSVAFYKRMDVSNKEIAFYTSLLYFPWVLKPLWSPIVDIIKTKRLWIILMQLLVTAGLAGVAFTAVLPDFFLYTMLCFSLIALCSATHDIAADGFYMLGLDSSRQAFYVGIRSTFYRLAMATAGLVLIIAGYYENKSSIPAAWNVTFIFITILFLLFFIYHNFILPYPKNDKPAHESEKHFFSVFIKVFEEFFKKKKIGSAIAFLLIYRFGEAQLVKLAQPFLLDPKNIGGLGLTTAEVGFAYGTLGVGALALGGILGGITISRKGFKKLIWWMFAAINLPHILYIYLAFFQPDNYFLITLCVAGEQFGYGFGFAGYLLFMIFISEGEFKTSHYALCTGFMALSMMIPGAFSGIIEEFLGYKLFFIWILITLIPGYFIIRTLPIDPEFGKKAE